MATTVFISYAGQDPQWPAATVRALGLELEAHGATVLLDQLHLQRQTEPGKLSIAEWREWMNTGLKQADRVICLVSARYRQAVARDLGETWGYGVACESMKLIGTLYRNKGRNNKWVLTLRPDGAPLDQIPEELQESCPEYQWPSERVQVIEHATRRPLPQAEAPAVAPAPPAAADPGNVPIGAGLVAQARLALERLQAHPALFQAIVRSRDGEDLQGAPAQALAEPAPFVQWLSSARRDDAQRVMWAVRSALEEHPGWCSDAGVQQAAVAVYMLCALRWVDGAPAADGSRVVAVPTVGRNVLAVLSAAFFGGRIEYSVQAGVPQPLHVYDVRAPQGQAASANLLRALYCALYPEEYRTLDIARRDDDDPAVIEEMVQRIQVRVNDIRVRRKAALTVVIDGAQAFEQAPWASRLDVTPFTVDDRLAQAVFLLEPHALDQNIQDFLREIRLQGAASGAPAAPSLPAGPAPAAPAVPSTSGISVHLHGDNANLSFGAQSPITSNVQQLQASVPLDELLAAIGSLRDEIAQLPSPRAREKMAGDLATLQDAVKQRPPDAKGRITKALEAIKHAGEAADGAEKVLGKLAKLKDLAAPILAALS